MEFIVGYTYQLVLLTTSAGLFGFKHMFEPTSVVNSVSFWIWLLISEVPAGCNYVNKIMRQQLRSI
jgi:hypothetical protein